MTSLPSKFAIDSSRLGLSQIEMDSMASLIQKNIQMLTPVDRGNLRNSIKVFPSMQDHSFVVTMGEHYGQYLNRGYKGFVMRSLIGRTVPVKLPGGRVIFRKATATNVGQRNISARDPRTGRIMAGNRPIRWYHPAQQPMRFVERGIENAMKSLSTLYGKVMMNQFMNEYLRLTSGNSKGYIKWQH